MVVVVVQQSLFFLFYWAVSQVLAVVVGTPKPRAFSVRLAATAKRQRRAFSVRPAPPSASAAPSACALRSQAPVHSAFSVRPAASTAPSACLDSEARLGLGARRLLVGVTQPAGPPAEGCRLPVPWREVGNTCWCCLLTVSCRQTANGTEGGPSNMIKFFDKFCCSAANILD